MKTYRKYTEVYSELQTLVRDKIAERVFLLPSEIPLANQLRTSRMTLRKALSKAEIDGHLIRENRKILIVDRTPLLRRCGKIRFIAPGEHSTFVHQALERLWLKLLGKVRAYNGDLEGYLLNETTTPLELDRKIAEADILLLTIPDGRRWVREKMLATSRLQHCKIIFTLTEDFSNGDFQNLITLDNNLAGKMAAELLYKGGAGKTIILSTVPHAEAHRKRAEGFTKRMEELGGAKPELFANWLNKPYPQFYVLCRERLKMAVREGFDGVFLVSDEGCDTILIDLFAENLIPKKIKVIAINGSGLALRSVPPITCLSHGTDAMVEELLRQFKLIASGDFKPPVQKLIVPTLYDNKTI